MDTICHMKQTSRYFYVMWFIHNCSRSIKINVWYIVFLYIFQLWYLKTLGTTLKYVSNNLNVLRYLLIFSWLYLFERNSDTKKKCHKQKWCWLLLQVPIVAHACVIGCTKWRTLQIICNNKYSTFFQIFLWFLYYLVVFKKLFCQYILLVVHM